jgi:hypothetical protein
MKKFCREIEVIENKFMFALKRKFNGHGSQHA